MNHKSFLFFTIITCIAAHHSPQATPTHKTRTLPASGTVHKASFFYEQTKTLPLGTLAPKHFNFATDTEIKALKKFSQSSSHKRICSSKNALIQQIKKYFKKQVSDFAKKTLLTKHEFSCLLITKDFLKTTNVSVILTKKKTHLEAEVTLFGFNKQPCPEILNLVTACIIDDPLVLKHPGKILCISGLIILSLLTKALHKKPLPPSPPLTPPQITPLSALKGTKPKKRGLRVRFADNPEKE